MVGYPPLEHEVGLYLAGGGADDVDKVIAVGVEGVFKTKRLRVALGRAGVVPAGTLRGRGERWREIDPLLEAGDLVGGGEGEINLVLILMKGALVGKKLGLDGLQEVLLDVARPHPVVPSKDQPAQEGRAERGKGPGQGCKDGCSERSEPPGGSALQGEIEGNQGEGCEPEKKPASAHERVPQELNGERLGLAGEYLKEVGQVGELLAFREVLESGNQGGGPVGGPGGPCCLRARRGVTHAPSIKHDAGHSQLIDGGELSPDLESETRHLSPALHRQAL